MRKGWEIKKLSEISEYFIGLTYSPKDVSDTKNGTVVLRSSNIQEGEIDLSDIVRVTCQVRDSLKIRKGDILMCSRNGSKRLVGKTAIIGDLSEEMTFGTFMTVIGCELNPYLFWFFKSDEFRNQIGGGENTMINQITKYMLDAVRVPLPPLDEQRRIVGVLDEAFVGIATARANAEKNLRNARELFESHLNAIFTQRGEGWVETVLGDQVEFAAGYAFKSSGYVSAENGTRLLRGDNIMQGAFRWEESVYWPLKDTITYDRFRLEENDIVLAMDRPWVSAGLKIACVSKEDLPCLQVQRTARLRTSNRLSWRYLFHLLRSQGFVDYLLDGQTGLGVPHISGKQILSYQFLLPSLAEQESTVTQLDALSAETQRLARIYESKLAALDELKKSLLHQAFSGEL